MRTPHANFGGAVTIIPDGLLLKPDFLSAEEERILLDFMQTVTYGNVRMHGVTAKRRVAQFGYHYSFDTYRLSPAPPVPGPLQDVRRRAAELAGVAPEEFAETLVTEYSAGAGIGWHRDAPPFGIVAGISLGAKCRMRFQKGEGSERITAAVELPARSIYLLTGPARTQWQHMIPPVKEPRWSITFRTLRAAAKTE